MKSQPHALLSRFERRVLRPLDFVFYGAAAYYLWHRAWLFGVLMLLLSLVVGVIGQGLPHRKHETVAELAAGTTFAGGYEGELSAEDSYALSKALFKTCTLIIVTAATIFAHEHWRWYWNLLTVAALWPTSFTGFLILTVGPIRMVQMMRRNQRV